MFTNTLGTVRRRSAERIARAEQGRMSAKSKHFSRRIRKKLNHFARLLSRKPISSHFHLLDSKKTIKESFCLQVLDHKIVNQDFSRRNGLVFLTKIYSEKRFNIFQPNNPVSFRDFYSSKISNWWLGKRVSSYARAALTNLVSTTIFKETREIVHCIAVRFIT